MYHFDESRRRHIGFCGACGFGVSTSIPPSVCFVSLGVNHEPLFCMLWASNRNPNLGSGISQNTVKTWVAVKIRVPFWVP